MSNVTHLPIEALKDQKNRLLTERDKLAFYYTGCTVLGKADEANLKALMELAINAVDEVRKYLEVVASQ